MILITLVFGKSFKHFHCDTLHTVLCTQYTVMMDFLKDILHGSTILIHKETCLCSILTNLCVREVPHLSLFFKTFGLYCDAVSTVMVQVGLELTF